MQALPILIIIALGALCGAISHRLASRLWTAVPIATGVATLLWVAGVYLLLFLTAPNELCPPLPLPFLLTFATAFVPALTAALLRQRHASRLMAAGGRDEGE